MSNWKLNLVDNKDYIKDRSGMYCLISWNAKADMVRIDFMSANHEALQSFCGDADDVRKHCMRWLSDNVHYLGVVAISLEHAAYIGSELEKADTMRADYIQDGVKTVTSDNAALTDAELLEKTEHNNKKKADDIVKKYG